MSVFISANIRDFEAVHKNLAVMYYHVMYYHVLSCIIMMGS